VYFVNKRIIYLLHDVLTNIQEEVARKLDEIILLSMYDQNMIGAFIFKALFVKIVVFKTKLFKVDWSGKRKNTFTNSFLLSCLLKA
jgi:hypothetical protein